MMISIDSLQEMQGIIHANSPALFFLSRKGCGVCEGLKAKMPTFLQAFPNLPAYYVDLADDEAIAGQFLIFSIPAILVFRDGKEIIREARFIALGELERKVGRVLGDEYKNRELKTFKEVKLDTRGFTFNRDEANER